MMRHRIIFIVTSFVTLLSVHILIYSYNMKIYNKREVAGWPQNTSREIKNYIHPDENTTLIEPWAICKSPSSPIFLLIVVCSSPFNVEARETIRQTWANHSTFNYDMFEKFHGKHKKNYLPPDEKHIEDWIQFSEEFGAKFNSTHTIDTKFNVQVAFLIGTVSSEEVQLQINYENDLYGDIIQENFVDSYNNLTLKTVLMLKWTSRNCEGKVKYVMKCDDDTFVNVPNLIHVLLGGTIAIYKSTIPFYDKHSINALNQNNRLPLSKDLLVGYKFCAAKPVSDTNSKWYAPGYLFDGDRYPDYLSGVSYSMTFHSLEKLYRGSLKTLFFHLEDVFLTGFVAEKVNIKRFHHPLIYYLSTRDFCSLRGMITQHQMTPMAIEEAYNFITNTSNVCLVPAKLLILSKMKLAQKKKCH